MIDDDTILEAMDNSSVIPPSSNPLRNTPQSRYEWAIALQKIQHIDTLTTAACLFGRRRLDSEELTFVKNRFHTLFMKQYNIQPHILQQYIQYIGPSQSTDFPYSLELMQLVYIENFTQYSQTIRWQVPKEERSDFLCNLLMHDTNHAFNWFITFQKQGYITAEIECNFLSTLLDITKDFTELRTVKTLKMSEVLSLFENPLPYPLFQRSNNVNQFLVNDNFMVQAIPKILTSKDFFDKYANHKHFLYFAVRDGYLTLLNDIFIPQTIDNRIIELYQNNLIDDICLYQYMCERSIADILHHSKQIPNLLHIMQWSGQHESIQYINPDCLYKDIDNYMQQQNTSLTEVHVHI